MRNMPNHLATNLVNFGAVDTDINWLCDVAQKLAA